MTARVYLDHAATTPMLPAAREVLLSASELVGNPSSLHAAGRRARRVVEEARESIAADLGVRPSAVVFTSGGTEADNLAVKGLFWAGAQRGARGLLVSAVEHHAVLDPATWLAEQQGADLVLLDVDGDGRVDPAAVRARADAGTVAACSVMWANNEVGTIQPVHEIAEACRTAGVAFHTDAVQALGQVRLDLSGIDAVTITAHKVGGPFGVGALVLDPRVPIVAVEHGGGQERDVRSGTLNAPAIAAFAVAVAHAVSGQDARAQRLSTLRAELERGICERVPAAVVNGDGRLPGICHLSFPGCEGDVLLMLLDAAGIDCATGSACTAGIPEPSHVLLAMGAAPAVARSSLRFSLGETSTRADVAAVVEAIGPVVDRARRVGALSERTA